MKANLIERTIEMTKSEATKAGKIGSPKANELQSYRTAYPDFTIKVKEEKKRSTYKGLDYDYMKKYIESHDNEEKTIMVEFNTCFFWNDSTDQFMVNFTCTLMIRTTCVTIINAGSS